MREHDAFRRPRGPRRVDDRVRIVRLDTGLAGRELARIPIAPARAEIRKRHVADAGLDADHVLERGQRRPNLLDLRGLTFVLTDHRPCLRIARHPFTLMRAVRGVDRDHHGPGGGDPVARERPLNACVGQHADTVARLDPELDEPERDLVDRGALLTVGQLGPLAPAAVPSGDAVGEPLCGRAWQHCDGPGDQPGSVSGLGHLLSPPSLRPWRPSRSPCELLHVHRQGGCRDSEIHEEPDRVWPICESPVPRQLAQRIREIQGSDVVVRTRDDDRRPARSRPAHTALAPGPARDVGACSERHGLSRESALAASLREAKSAAPSARIGRPV